MPRYATWLACVVLVGCKGSDVGPRGDDGPRYATAFTLVEVEPDLSASTALTLQACAGLKNRELGGSVYVEWGEEDQLWLDDLALVPADVVSSTAFVDACLVDIPRCVPYSYDRQHELLPSILTAASALDAVPVDTGGGLPCGRVVWDAVAELADKATPHQSTRHVFAQFADQTTGLAMLNPGYDIDAPDLANPDLIHDMSPALVDFVFSRRLFVTFLVNGCVPPHPENDLLLEMATAGHWPTPIGVFGYNDSWLIGGYLYEAQSRCLASRNMGAIPTKTQNLSFFSTRRPPIEGPGVVAQNPPEPIAFDPTKTYVAFVIGDGDNVRFVMTTRNAWLKERLQICADTPDACAPITWSLSPQLPHLAPDVLEWYYASARQTGHDSFVLPPSGNLYAYPTSLNADDRARFIAATERDAEILDVAGTVHWDWFEDWAEAEEEVLPLYGDGPIQGIVPVNVPYLSEAFPWWPDEAFYRVLTGPGGGQVVVFRPRQWRGIDGRDSDFFLTPEAMAAELAGYPPGTVTAIYTTSDGGLSLSNAIAPLTGLLPDHVELVSVDTAARLALEATGRR